VLSFPSPGGAVWMLWDVDCMVAGGVRGNLSRRVNRKRREGGAWG
jgi:hypothetical protein